jgi:AcrR family transcriptional regulator
LNKSQAKVAEEVFEQDSGRTTGRRVEFVDIAIRLFSGRPYAEVSIEEVATEAGVAKSLLYYYFGSKRGLYVAGLQRLSEEMHAQIGVAAGSSDVPMERLMLALDAHLAFVERYPAGYRELLNSASSHPEIKAVMESGQTALLEMVLAGLPPEVPRGPAVTLAVQGWGSFVDGVELAWLTNGGMDRALVRELCSRVLVGSIVAAIEVDKETRKAARSAAKQAAQRSSTTSAQSA